MFREFRRQLIHLSGVLFVILAQFVGRELSIAYFFIIAATFLLYSFHVRSLRKRWWKTVEKMEAKIRDVTMSFERPRTMPFQGAFWFYFGCGLAFLLFPFHLATAACIILAIGDGASTIFGLKFGKRKIIGNRSYAGSIAFLVSSLIATLIFMPAGIAIAGSIAGAIGEILPGAFGKNRNWFIDDNWIIPLLSGAAMLGVSLL